MSSNNIDYASLIDEAMQNVVKKCLEKAQKNNQLPGNHHFFISFLTHARGVIISNKLKKKYPKEMTIVLQHQFEELNVFENRFSVKLSFDGVLEEIIVPWKTLTAFADPSVQFGLQFSFSNLDDNEENYNITELDNELHQDTVKSKIDISKSHPNVISLDQFRKK